MIVKGDGMDKVAKDILGWPKHRKWNSKEKDSRVRAFFGAPLDVIVVSWNLFYVSK